MARLPVLLLLSLLALLAACSQPPTATGLTVRELYPADGANNVPVNAEVLVVFDGAVDGGELTGALTVTLDGATVQGTTLLDEATNMMIFTPAAELSFATGYSVTLAGSVRSLSGAAMAEATTWSFTTEADQSASNGDPAEDNDADGLPDDIDPDPANPDTDDDGLQDGDDLDPVDPDVDGDGITDGDPAELGIPGLVSASPAPWSRVKTLDSVSITFEEAIDPATLDASTILAFELPEGNRKANGTGHDPAPIAGTLSYDGLTATFTFDEPLQPNRWYWVFLEVDVMTLGGDPVQGNNAWRFRTAE